MSMNFLHFFALISIIGAQEADITIPPQSVNITINKVAAFHCVGVANSFTWRANGQQLDHGEGVAITPVALVNETLQIRKSTLRMTVTSVKNATNITCTAFLQNPISIDRSSPALLLVQGLLEPVSNLTAAFVNSTTTLISWISPFTLEGVPILGYNSTITTGGENKTISVEENTTMLYYSIDNCDTDNKCIVTVVPINEVGAGEPAMLQIEPTLKEYITTSRSQVVSTMFTSSHGSDEGVLLSTATSSFTINLSPTTPVQNNRTTALIVTIVSCVVVLMIIITVTAVTCALVLSKKRKSPSSQNKIPVDDNPAYEEVTLKLRRIDVQENSAYSTYNPYSIII